MSLTADDAVVDDAEALRRYARASVGGSVGVQRGGQAAAEVDTTHSLGKWIELMLGSVPFFD